MTENEVAEFNGELKSFLETMGKKYNFICKKSHITYYDLEVKMVNASKKYMNNTYKNIENNIEIPIKLKTLVNSTKQSHTIIISIKDLDKYYHQSFLLVLQLLFLYLLYMLLQTI